MLKLLLAVGANPRLKTEHGKTALDIVIVGSAQIIRRHLARQKQARKEILQPLPSPGRNASTN